MTGCSNFSPRSSSTKSARSAMRGSQAEGVSSSPDRLATNATPPAISATTTTIAIHRPVRGRRRCRTSMDGSGQSVQFVHSAGVVGIDGSTPGSSESISSKVPPCSACAGRGPFRTVHACGRRKGGSLVRAPRPVLLVVALLTLAFAGSAGTYTVRWGDTLGGIARQLGVSVQDLVTANGLRDANRIREGQVLAVPARVAAQPIAAVTPASSPGVVRVAAGETLGGIARRHGTTVAAIASLNGIRNVNQIREGAILRVPAAAAPAATWVCPVRGPVKYIGRFGDARGAGRRHLGV